ncbi:substrate-binding domain-containing protein [Actinomadura sp. HBU206391]|uniref:substrate-binding domain-containing protein n=1 Tax=Actinomadura sp. HBU206391 TaxID=2731692 RepID=UPI00165025F8|nr:substrate-binding domain-containing protein [Actinomadura sp. HBU206391]MBC6461348.1 substrate-binding domain-containing protein [Actinomadura sp. HBU206391]
MAVRYLAGHGRRRLAPAASPTLRDHHGKSYAVRTRTGFTTAAKSLGLAHSVQPCRPTWDGVRAWLDLLERERPDARGIVVQNEAALPLLLATLRQRNRRVPEDVSVVAICPRAIAEQQEPPLTFIDIPATALGSAATEALLRLLGNEDVPAVRLLPARLEEGASCSDLLAPA